MKQQHMGMANFQITKVDRSTEGLMVTFEDGHTFLFTAASLFAARLKYGQLMETQPQKTVEDTP